MEVKRAFRCYRGPDDPGPFSDIINSMSFGCRHMKEYNRNGVFCLTAKTPEGYVKVMRVGDVDYIWTESGKMGALYIILVPDLVRGFIIPVALKKDGYSFGEIAGLPDSWDVVRYRFDVDFAGMQGTLPRFEYMPYIFKAGSSHASVGDYGGQFTRDPLDDWHYKFYVLDCTGEASPKETLWRPPGQGSGWAFGQDLLPPWYSMSPFTSHAFHWCFEAAIDQAKRLYQPYNIVISLPSEEVATPSGLTLINRSFLQYNFMYQPQLNRFYGKNAYSHATDGSLLTWGEHIYVSGVGTSSIPEGIDPVFFFWPWIPYLDEIRGFNILAYRAKHDIILDVFEGWYMYPEVDTFSKYGIGYYNAAGGHATEELAEESGTFSDITGARNTSTSDGPTDCSCGKCGTGTWSTAETTHTDNWVSSGTKQVPIGLIGGKIPIIMKTTWSQTGVGPSGSNSNQATISGNYPYVSLTSGEGFSIIYWYEQCCTSFANTHVRASSGSESASNEITIDQELKVGDDVIFSGQSSMSYEMTHDYQEAYNASIQATVTPPGQTIPTCAGHINYTSQQMNVEQTQNLSWTDDTSYPALQPCEEQVEFTFTWSLSGGGSISSTTDQSITYTAPDDNVGCGKNATISLLCNGAAIDTLEIAINGDATNDWAYSIKECYSEPLYVALGVDNCQQTYRRIGCCICARAHAQAYRCDGTLRGTVAPWALTCGTPTYPPLAGQWYGFYRPPSTPNTGSECIAKSCNNPYYSGQHSSCASCDSEGVSFQASGHPAGWGTVDKRTAAQIAAGCCPAALM